MAAEGALTGGAGSVVSTVNQEMPWEAVRFFLFFLQVAEAQGLSNLRCSIVCTYLNIEFCLHVAHYGPIALMPLCAGLGGRSQSRHSGI